MGAFVKAAVVTAAFGDAITVTRPQDLAPIPAVGIWREPEVLQDSSLIDTDYSRMAPQRVMAIPITDDLPNVPKGTCIMAPLEQGGTVYAWTVDSLFGSNDGDMTHVVLRRTS